MVVTEVRGIEFNFTPPSALVLTVRSADSVTINAHYPMDARYETGPGGLSVAIKVDRIDGGFRFTANPAWAKNVTVRLADHGEHFFGVIEQLYPNNQKSPDLRGNVVEVDALGDEAQYHENYASAWSPFYMTNRGYASFFDSFAKGRYSLGVNGQTELYHQTGKLDWFLLFGADGDDILTSYYKIIGAPKSPPMWALGPVVWRDESTGSAQIMDDVRQFTALHIPLTAWWLDRPYSEGANSWSKMNFSPAFSPSSGWINELGSKYDVKLMTWVAPMTFGDKDFPGLFEGPTSYLESQQPRSNF